MASFNRIIMMGNLTRDPEMRQLPSGQGVCRFGLASNRQYRNKQSGDMVQEVCFIDVDVWGAQAESCSKYLTKGRPVLVEGRLKFDTWQTQDGSTRSKHAIVADRVVFMAAANTEREVESEDSQRLASQQAALDHAQQTAAQTNSTQFTAAQKEPMAHKGRKKKEDGEAADGAVAFQDEPPFQDDLPF